LPTEHQRSRSAVRAMMRILRRRTQLHEIVDLLTRQAVASLHCCLACHRCQQAIEKLISRRRPVLRGQDIDYALKDLRNWHASQQSRITRNSDCSSAEILDFQSKYFELTIR